MCIRDSLYTLEHAFLPSDMTTRIVGWTTILLSFIVGPIIAARVHGGKLQQGKKAIALINWLVILSSKFGHQDVENMSKSQSCLIFIDIIEHSL